MRRIVIILVLFLFMPGTAYSVIDLDIVIQQITKMQNRKWPHLLCIFAEKDWFDFSEYININQESDTIFIREYLPTGEVYGPVSVWNKTSGVKVSFIGTADELIQKPDENLEKETIGRWDTLRLRVAPIDNKGVLRDIHSAGHVWTTRIVVHNGFASFETITYPLFNTYYLDQ